jgi:diaminopimelate epimerase
MFNPDGSEFERSGNGLRILGSFLYSDGRVRMREPFPVEVGGETVEMEILAELDGGELDVAVDMGRARFGPEAVSANSTVLSRDSTLQGPDGSFLAVHPVSIGNPHCVLFRDALGESDLLALGPFLTSHGAFPNGTNVQLAEVKGDREVEILIWERGVGRTTSSGTSACAVAAASVYTSRVSPGKIRIVMEGGSFQVSVTPKMDVRLQGPVRPVFSGRLRPEFLTGLTREVG